MKKKQTFEAALARLSEITEAVEDGGTTLDAAISLYKEGIALSKDCSEILTRFETEIVTLQKQADEVFKLVPFEP